ncbi:Hypothetical protein NTJ_05903 [Nesidiocoris tenuis]|uniref:Uncharacterized protein n=1 Tax=Nesidiocoris tenuis TaxID=355587 RepID=A0ABN7ANT9_9HEMI|nr:Hypothetical protein NTJ_05903 [Nesidiocoris tenuis]
MADRKRWTSMNSSSSSRRFGLYAEKTTGKLPGGRGRRCWFFLAFFLAAVIVISLTVLSISTGKGRKKLIIVTDSKVEDAGNNFNKSPSTGSPSNLLPTLETVYQVNATTQESRTDHEESISRPETISSTSSMSIFDDKSGDIPTTAAYEQTNILDSETSATSEPLIRQGRIINDPVTSPYRMRLPPRFALGPSPPHPRTHPSMRDPGHSHVSHGDLVAYPGQTDHISFPDHRDLVAFQPQVPAEYSERFAQMEAYKNGQKAILEATNDRKTSVVQKAPAIKITGIYIRGPAEELEHFDLKDELQQQETTQLNGHAYMSDPLKKYKPAHPSEINHLATLTSDSENGYRFSNKVRATLPPLDDAEMGASSPSDLTQAIFHPYKPGPVSDPSLPTLPAPTPTPGQVRNEKKGRPLKIMLDIYPFQESDLLEQGSTVGGERPRLPPIRTGRQPQPVLVHPLPTPQPQPLPTPTQPSRMIVHLNLFPKKTQKNGQRRTTPLPAVMTFVPGGGTHFEDRMFDSPDESVKHGVGVASSSSAVNRPIDQTASSDQSIEIAETYPAIPGDQMTDRKDTVSAFILTDDQLMQPSSSYRFVVGENDNADVEEGEEQIAELGDDQAYAVFDDSDEDDSRETDDERHGKTRQYFEKENEGSRNGYKVVSFEVTSGGGGVGGGSDVINEGGILRSRNTNGEMSQQKNIGGESDEHSGKDGSGNVEGDDYEAYDNPGDGGGNRSSEEESNPKNRDPLRDGIKIKSIKGDENVGNGRQNDHMMYPDDGGEIPVGVAVESETGNSQLDFVPGYNEGSIIEPRYDTISSSQPGVKVGAGHWWPTNEMWRSGSTVSITTGRPIVFPTSEMPSAEEPINSFITTPFTIVRA